MNAGSLASWWLAASLVAATGAVTTGSTPPSRPALDRGTYLATLSGCPVVADPQPRYSRRPGLRNGSHRCCTEPVLSAICYRGRRTTTPAG